MFLHKKFFAPFSFSSPSGTPNMQILFPLMLPNNSFKVSSLFIVLCFLPIWNSSSDLSPRSLIYSSASSSLFLNPSIAFFSSFIVFFHSVMSIWYFLIFSFCWRSHCVHSFSQFHRARLLQLLWTFYKVNYFSVSLMLRFFPLKFCLILLFKHIALFLHFAYFCICSYALGELLPLQVSKEYPCVWDETCVLALGCLSIVVIDQAAYF